AFLALSALLGSADEDFSLPFLVVFLGMIVACAGFGVTMRILQFQGGRGSTHAAAVLYVAAGIPLLGLFTQEPDWDSGTLVLKVLITLCLVGGFLTALPQFVRRILVSAFFVYHFLGIVMAGMTLPSAGG